MSDKLTVKGRVIALFMGTLFILIILEVFARFVLPMTIRNVGPSFTFYDPVYGKSLKKSFSTQRVTPEFTMKITTNSEGFRGPELESLSLRPILFLGDSLTMGYGVNDGEEFPALVRKALNERGSDTVPVVNAGLGDNGNGRWVKFLRTEGKRYNPGLVVLQIHANDFRDNIREQLFELTSTGELHELPVPPPGVKRTVQRLVESIPGLAHSYLIGLGRQVSWVRPYPLGDFNSKDLPNNRDQTLREKQLLFRLLDKVLTICEEERWPVLAVLANNSDKRLVALEKFLLVRDIPTVVIPAKSEKRRDLYYQIDGHWNVSGHRVTAVRILEGIAAFDLKYW